MVLQHATSNPDNRKMTGGETRALRNHDDILSRRRYDTCGYLPNAHSEYILDGAEVSDRGFRCNIYVVKGESLILSVLSALFSFNPIRPTVLQEVHDGNNAALLTGVFDGHGGNSTSTTLAQLLPSLFSVELAGLMSESATGKAKSSDLREAMASAYEITCNAYRNGCDEEGGCVADYDPRQGIVLAGMESTDLVAGSTVTVAVLGMSEDGAGELSVLNCGDSRTQGFCGVLFYARPLAELSN